MTILSVAYPLLTVGPDSAGGAEQILYLLERGLVERGHQSIVIAAKGSIVRGRLIESPVAGGEMAEEIRTQARRDHFDLIERTLNRYPIDLIHFHGLDFYEYLPPRNVPKLATLHLPLEWYPEWIFHSPGLRLNCVSESQARSRKLPFVLNGIDVTQYLGASHGREFLLWMGRICPEKGTDVALEVAHRLDLPLMVAGPVHAFADHQKYFFERVQPLLDEKRQYIGPVGLGRKIELLGNARCLLIPSLVAETSSLVAMEAISSGTPVVAFRSGALPEVVDHGVTGFIVDSADEMANAIGRTGDISSETCRQTAKVRFEASRMIADYLALYRKYL